MSSELNITRAISTHLNDLAGGWPVSWPNLPFDPGSADYLRLSFIPAGESQADLGTAGRNEVLGIAQIDVFYFGQDGWSDAYTKADEIKSHFKRGTKLTNGGVDVCITSAELGVPLNTDEGYMQLPISINYRAYTAN